MIDIIVTSLFTITCTKKLRKFEVIASCVFGEHCSTISAQEEVVNCAKNSTFTKSVLLKNYIGSLPHKNIQYLRHHSPQPNCFLQLYLHEILLVKIYEKVLFISLRAHVRYTKKSGYTRTYLNLSSSAGVVENGTFFLTKNIPKEYTSNVYNSSNRAFLGISSLPMYFIK